MTRRILVAVTIILGCAGLGATWAAASPCTSSPCSDGPQPEAPVAVAVQPPDVDVYASRSGPLTRQASVSPLPLAALSVGALGVLATLALLLRARRAWPLTRSVVVPVVVELRELNAIGEDHAGEAQVTPPPRMSSVPD